MGLLSIAKGLISPLFGVIDKAVRDKDLAAQLKHDLQTQGIALVAAELDAQKSVIVAEANSESWIARNWRPITMLTFVGLVVAKWLGLTTDVSEGIEIELMELIKIGLGGYVVGRSAEKVATVWKEK